jgi:hypothetical protein
MRFRSSKEKVEVVSWQKKNGLKHGRRSLPGVWYLYRVTRENIIPEAGGHKGLYTIFPNVYDAVFAISSVLRGVSPKTVRGILWRIWITARVVVSAPMNAGLVPSQWLRRTEP